MLYIFISQYDNYWENVDKIKSHNMSGVKQIYVEDYLNSPINFSKEDIVYFLTNTLLVKEVINKINNQCVVINRGYYLNDLTDKYSIQQKLYNNKIMVPQLLSADSLNRYSFPIMCKSKSHANFIIAIFTLSTFTDIMLKYNVGDFYLERFIKCTRELKAYFVKDKTFLYDNENNFKYFKELNETLRKIGNLLNLEVFSVDILLTENAFYVIDVNPAAGLFNSKASRQYFVEW